MHGALVATLLRPDRWGGFAALAPDACFDYAYLPDFAEAGSALRQRGGSVERFWQEILQKEKLSGSDHALMNSVAMAACYSPGPDGAPELPWNPNTGALDTRVWERWLNGIPSGWFQGTGPRSRVEGILAGVWGPGRVRLYVGASVDPSTVG